MSDDLNDHENFKFYKFFMYNFRLEQLESQVKGGVSAAPAPAAEEDDDDVDLFGSDEEDDAAAEELKVILTKLTP